MKRILAFLLLSTVLLNMSACGNKKPLNAEETLVTVRDEFEQYITENIYGVWIADDPNSQIEKYEITEEQVIQTRKSGTVNTWYITEDFMGRSFPVVEFNSSTGIPQLTLTVSSSKDSTSHSICYITWHEDTYSANRLIINNSGTYTKAK